MKTRILTAACLALAIVLTLAPSHAAAGDTPFTQMAEHYEAIWKALSADTVEGVAEHAAAIAEIARAADHPAEVSDAADIPAAIAEQAKSLAVATDIGAARGAFFDLTRPMVRYRKAVAADELKVAYCPMAKKAWLQPEGNIRNPYHGSEMLTCGGFVGS